METISRLCPFRLIRLSHDMIDRKLNPGSGRLALDPVHSRTIPAHNQVNRICHRPVCPHYSLDPDLWSCDLGNVTGLSTIVICVSLITISGGNAIVRK